MVPSHRFVFVELLFKQGLLSSKKKGTKSAEIQNDPSRIGNFSLY